MSAPNAPTVWLEDIYGGLPMPWHDRLVGSVPASRATPVAGPELPPSLAARVGGAVNAALYVAWLLLVGAFFLHVGVGVLFLVVAALGQ